MVTGPNDAEDTKIRRDVSAHVFLPVNTRTKHTDTLLSD